jgi:hypothetical protein
VERHVDRQRGFRRLDPELTSKRHDALRLIDALLKHGVKIEQERY